MKWTEVRYDTISKDIGLYLATDAFAPLLIMAEGKIEQSTFIPNEPIDIASHGGTLETVIFNDENMLPIKKDQFHFHQTYCDAVSKKDPLFGRFSSWLSNAFFIISSESYRQAKARLIENGMDKTVVDCLPRQYFVKNQLVKRYIPKVCITFVFLKGEFTVA